VRDGKRGREEKMGRGMPEPLPSTCPSLVLAKGGELQSQGPRRGCGYAPPLGRTHAMPGDPCRRRGGPADDVTTEDKNPRCGQGKDPRRREGEA
jgi:hypothetical protein